MSDSQFMRFFYVASFNAIATAIWTALIIIPPDIVNLRLPQIISTGSAGTWFFVGYITFMTVGCAGILGCGTVHHIISTVKNKTPNSKVTWLGLILWEIGLVGSTWLLGWSGFVGGTGLLNGLPIPQIHESIVGYVNPIGILIGIAILGFLISIVNVYVALARK
ncbi:MAG: hypothetical protein QXF43_00830 [Nitrososphaerales archaeon]